MTLPANLDFRAFGEKRRVLSDLSELVTIGGFLHDRVASDAAHAAAGMGARIPISLDTALVAGQTRLVLKLNGLAGVLAKGNKAADSFSPATRDVIASRSVAVLTRLFLRFIARIEQKNFPHQGLRKFFELSRVAGFTDFVADVNRRFLLGRSRFSSK
jgi:hypothetical protein